MTDVVATEMPRPPSAGESLPDNDLPADRAADPLTRGLARNTLFNLIGWILPVMLAFVSVPFILNGLGTERYGVFALVSIVAGYLGLLNGPLAFGNVRFMAEAYGRRDWLEFHKYVVAGLWMVGLLAGCGGIILFLSADFLAHSVFKIPDELEMTAATVFRIAAISFFLNGIAGALGGIPSAMRRYDAQNVISVTVGTLNTFAIVAAIWLGWGLYGAVIAQLCSSFLAVTAFAILAWWLLRSSPREKRSRTPDKVAVRRLFSYSTLLFGSQLMSTIGLQIDRTLAGVMLGASAVTFYTIPARITDQVPGLVGRLTTTLYPLSAEGVATGRILEVQKLYVRMVRLMLLVSAFIGSLVMLSAKDILTLWVGNDIAEHSWQILVLLAIGVIWRAPGTVAYQIVNGLGRADFNLGIGLMMMVLTTLLAITFSLPMGLVGIALGMAIGLMISNMVYDLLTQRLFLNQLNWWVYVRPYLQTIFTVTTVIVISIMLPTTQNTIVALLTKMVIYSLAFLASSLLWRLLNTQDMFVVASKFRKNGLSLPSDSH